LERAGSKAAAGAGCRGAEGVAGDEMAGLCHRNQGTVQRPVGRSGRPSPTTLRRKGPDKRTGACGWQTARAAKRTRMDQIVVVVAVGVGIPLWLGLIYAVWRMERKERQRCGPKS
jgi:hypothetical protein